MSKKNPLLNEESTIANALEHEISITGAITPDSLVIHGGTTGVFHFIDEEVHLLDLFIADSVPPLEIVLAEGIIAPRTGSPWHLERKDGEFIFSLTVDNGTYELTAWPKRDFGGIAMVGTVAMKNKQESL